MIKVVPDEKLMSDFREFLMSRKMSRQKFSDLSGISLPSLNNYVRGKYYPGERVADQLRGTMTALECTSEDPPSFESENTVLSLHSRAKNEALSVPDDSQCSVDWESELKELMCCLTERQAQVARLYFIDKLMQKEIATRLGVTRSDVEVLLVRASDILKEAHEGIMRHRSRVATRADGEWFCRYMQADLGLDTWRPQLRTGSTPEAADWVYGRGKCSKLHNQTANMSVRRFRQLRRPISNKT